MKKDLVSRGISGILPEGLLSTDPSGSELHELISESADELLSEIDGKERKRLERNERERLRRAERRNERNEALSSELGVPIPAGRTERAARGLKALEDTRDALGSIELNSPEPFEIGSNGEVPSGLTPEEALRLQGSSRRDIACLLTTLNINLSVRLTKGDTANLLACLLTCNETQLEALSSNPKIPLAIKTVITRLRNDSRDGRIDTIERLWDRVFGKGPLQSDPVLENVKSQDGIIPNTPISREAYILIRDTLIK